MKTSKNITPATDAIDQIKAIGTVEELNAFVTDAEDRKTVLKARDERYTELTESGGGDDDDETQKEEESGENGKVNPKETPSDSSDQDPGQVIELQEAEYKALEKTVRDKLTEQKIRFVNGVLPEGPAKEIEESYKEVFKTPAAEVSGPVNVSEVAFGSLLLAINHQLVMDKGRRGLSSPSKLDKDLIDLYEAITQEEE